MCLSLIGLYISFLLSQLWGRHYNEVSNARPVCATFSALVQYFLLVYFCITVAQSILLYVKLVMVVGGQSNNLQEFYHINAGIISWSKLLMFTSKVMHVTTILETRLSAEYLQQSTAENYKVIHKNEHSILCRFHSCNLQHWQTRKAILNSINIFCHPFLVLLWSY